MQYYLAIIFGCFVFILLQLNGVFTLPSFTWKIFFKTNIIPTILNLVIGCSLVFIRLDIEKLYPITLLSAFILGISGQAILKKLTNMFDKTTDTLIGVNEK
jgi:hypothetical protein